eukprot:6511465-Prymnesium_polylepis.1
MQCHAERSPAQRSPVLSGSEKTLPARRVGRGARRVGRGGGQPAVRAGQTNTEQAGASEPRVPGLWAGCGGAQGATRAVVDDVPTEAWLRHRRVVVARHGETAERRLAHARLSHAHVRQQRVRTACSSAHEREREREEREPSGARASLFLSAVCSGVQRCAAVCSGVQ